MSERYTQFFGSAINGSCPGPGIPRDVIPASVVSIGEASGSMVTMTDQKSGSRPLLLTNRERMPEATSARARDCSRRGTSRLAAG